MKRHLLPVLLSGCMLVIISCKKGDTGPAGAIGPAGPVGPVGTANIIYSPWANVTFVGSGNVWAAMITAPGVTQDIIDKGVVKTYFKFGASVYEGNYTNIPTGAGTYYFLAVGAINLRATFAANYPWRYVIIPGGAAGRRIAGAAGPDMFVLKDGTAIKKRELNNMSYEEVCKRFNIPLK